MSTSNCNPPRASNYITLNWNYNGQTVNLSENVRVAFTLIVGDRIAGIGSFGFDISIVGCG